MLYFTSPDTLIRVRPWQGDTFLYFPFDYHRGGIGVIIPAEYEKRYRLMVWSPINYVAIPFVIVMAAALAFLPQANWAYGIGALLGAAAGYGFLKYKQHLYDTILRRYPAAPVTLTAERYWQEYASAQSWSRILFATLFWSLFLISLIMSTILDPAAFIEHPLRGLLFLAGYAYAFVHGRFALLRFSHKYHAIKLGISAGSPLHADTLAATTDTAENIPHPHPPHQTG